LTVGSLLRVAVVCVGSAALSSTVAFAEESTTKEVEETPVEEPDEAREDVPTGRSAGYQDLAMRLKSREASIDRRERSLADREGDLNAVVERLDARLEELKAIREEIGTQLKEVDEETLERRNGLVKMFEGMRSKDSAAVMSELDGDLAVQVLDNMNRTKAGKLLAALSPVEAARLAEKMARPIVLGR
jgi:flagellar motility protein MotE (MotC chaperone)